MRETTGGVFRQTIRLPFTIRGHEVMAVLREVAGQFEGQTYHTAQRYREELCYAIGTVHNLDIAEILLLNTYHDDPQLWHHENWYDAVIVCDAVWNEGIQGEPLPPPKYWSTDIIISTCKQFAENLETALLAFCEAKVATN